MSNVRAISSGSFSPKKTIVGVLAHGGEVGHEDELRRLPTLRGAHTGSARARGAYQCRDRPCRDEARLLGRRQHPRRRSYGLDGGTLPDRTPPRTARFGRPPDPPPGRTSLLRAPPSLPRRRRALLDDGLHPAGDPETLARARRGAWSPPRGYRR